MDAFGIFGDESHKGKGKKPTKKVCSTCGKKLKIVQYERHERFHDTPEVFCRKCRVKAKKNKMMKMLEERRR